MSKLNKEIIIVYSIKFLIVFSLLFVVIKMIIRSNKKEERINNNPVSLDARVTHIKRVSNFDTDLYIEYRYKGIEYKNAFYGVGSYFGDWCGKRGECKGLIIPITINKNNPKEYMSEWMNSLAEYMSPNYDSVSRVRNIDNDKDRFLYDIDANSPRNKKGSHPN